MVDDGHQHATDELPILNNNSNNNNISNNNNNNNISYSSSSDDSRSNTHRRGQPEPSGQGDSTLPGRANSAPATGGGLPLVTPAPHRGPSNQTAAASQPSRGAGAFAGLVPASKQVLLKPPLISQEKFHWDQTEQGHILGAFFYGYILFQISGARMAELVGARWILLTSTAGSALISLVFPLSTQLDSIHLLMVLRFVMGLCQSAFFPAAYVFLCRWLPEAERSVLLPIMFIGSNMGSISTYIMSSYLITSSYGWPSVFYVSGMICSAVTLLWCVFGSNGPQDNWLITDSECNYILDNTDGGERRQRPAQARSEAAAGHCGRPHRDGPLRGPVQPARPAAAAPAPKINKSKSANDLNPAAHYARFQAEVVLLEPKAAGRSPQRTGAEFDGSLEPAEQEARRLSWCKLLSSVPVWTLIFSMYGNEWSQVVLTYELPSYLTKALNIPIEQNGLINSFFQLSYTVASPVLSSLGAYMLKRRPCGMRKIHVRKLFQSLATFGQLVCFASVPVCGANRGLIIMFMFLAWVCKACANAGDIMVSGDLSPEFAGTIFAIANTVGNTAGFFVPMLAGVIVDEQYKRERWTPFWLTTASIMGCSGMIFLAFGETRRQDYSHDDDDHRGKSGQCAIGPANGAGAFGRPNGRTPRHWDTAGPPAKAAPAPAGGRRDRRDRRAKRTSSDELETGQ